MTTTTSTNVSNLVPTWLNAANLGYAIPNFEMAGIITPRSFADLELQYFEPLGVTDGDDRKRLFYLIQRVRGELRKKEEDDAAAIAATAATAATGGAARPKTAGGKDESLTRIEIIEIPRQNSLKSMTIVESATKPSRGGDKENDDDNYCEDALEASVQSSPANSDDAPLLSPITSPFATSSRLRHSNVVHDIFRRGEVVRTNISNRRDSTERVSSISALSTTEYSNMPARVSTNPFAPSSRLRNSLSPININPSKMSGISPSVMPAKTMNANFKSPVREKIEHELEKRAELRREARKLIDQSHPPLSRSNQTMHNDGNGDDDKTDRSQKSHDGGGRRSRKSFLPSITSSRSFDVEEGRTGEGGGTGSAIRPSSSFASSRHRPPVSSRSNDVLQKNPPLLLNDEDDDHHRRTVKQTNVISSPHDRAVGSKREAMTKDTLSRENSVIGWNGEEPLPPRPKSSESALSDTSDLSASVVSRPKSNSGRSSNSNSSRRRTSSIPSVASYHSLLSGRISSNITSSVGGSPDENRNNNNFDEKKISTITSKKSTRSRGEMKLLSTIPSNEAAHMSLLACSTTQLDIFPSRSVIAASTSSDNALSNSQRHGSRSSLGGGSVGSSHFGSSKSVVSSKSVTSESKKEHYSKTAASSINLRRKHLKSPVLPISSQSSSEDGGRGSIRSPIRGGGRAQSPKRSAPVRGGGRAQSPTRSVASQLSQRAISPKKETQQHGSHPHQYLPPKSHTNDFLPSNSHSPKSAAIGAINLNSNNAGVAAGATFVHGAAEDTSFKTQISRTRESFDQKHTLYLTSTARQRRKLEHEEHDDEHEMRIRVIVRKRPMSNKESSDTSDIDAVQSLDYDKFGRILVHQPKVRLDLAKEVETTSFAFDNVFNEESNNVTIYERAIQSLIPGVFHGKWASVFAYGQTGSGKTVNQLYLLLFYMIICLPKCLTCSLVFRPKFTMMGCNATGRRAGNQVDNSRANLGLYCLAAQDVFRIQQDPAYANMSIGVSLFEIYGGKLLDLLNARNPVRCLEDSRGKVQFPGLSEHAVSSAEELMSVIDAGALNRSTGTTSANADSSRSHAVLHLSLRKDVGRTKNKEIGRLTFIDLAGSERGADTSMASKTTRMEGAEINTSLLALKEVIRALATGSSLTRIPFRGSKLTQVLKESFVGKNSRTVMVSCVAPNMKNCVSIIISLYLIARCNSSLTYLTSFAVAYSGPYTKYTSVC